MCSVRMVCVYGALHCVYCTYAFANLNVMVVHFEYVVVFVVYELLYVSD